MAFLSRPEEGRIDPFIRHSLNDDLVASITQAGHSSTFIFVDIRCTSEDFGTQLTHSWLLVHEGDWDILNLLSATYVSGTCTDSEVSWTVASRHYDGLGTPVRPFFGVIGVRVAVGSAFVALGREDECAFTNDLVAIVNAVGLKGCTQHAFRVRTIAQV